MITRSSAGIAIVAVATAIAGVVGSAAADPVDGGRDPAIVSTDNGPVRGIVANDHRSFQ
jgi:para-nitrobenzyl esterase